MAVNYKIVDGLWGPIPHLVAIKLKLMKCKNVKGKDGFTVGKIYDVLYAGRVYWVENDYGKRICDSDESFEPV